MQRQFHIFFRLYFVKIFGQPLKTATPVCFPPIRRRSRQIPLHLLYKKKKDAKLTVCIFFLGGNEVSDIELYGYGKETKYVVKIEL